MLADNVAVAGVQFLLNGVNLGAEDLSVAIFRFMEHIHCRKWNLYINRPCT